MIAEAVAPVVHPMKRKGSAWLSPAELVMNVPFGMTLFCRNMVLKVGDMDESWRAAAVDVQKSILPLLSCGYLLFGTRPSVNA
jgi:hypothetical protein